MLSTFGSQSFISLHEGKIRFQLPNNFFQRFRTRSVFTIYKVLDCYATGVIGYVYKPLQCLYWQWEDSRNLETLCRLEFCLASFWYDPFAIHFLMLSSNQYSTTYYLFKLRNWIWHQILIFSNSADGKLVFISYGLTQEKYGKTI